MRRVKQIRDEGALLTDPAASLKNSREATTSQQDGLQTLSDVHPHCQAGTPLGTGVKRSRLQTSSRPNCDREIEGRNKMEGFIYFLTGESKLTARFSIMKWVNEEVSNQGPRGWRVG